MLARAAREERSAPQLHIFFDACTKYSAVYYGKITTAAEMLLVFKQFITDHVRWMPKGRVEEWYKDGGPEFKSREPVTSKSSARRCTRAVASLRRGTPG